MSDRTARGMERAKQSRAYRKRQALWLGVACLVVAAVAYGVSILLREEGLAPDSGNGSPASQPQVDAALRTIIDRGGVPVAKPQADEALETIRKHRAQLEANPEAPDAPGLLSAMASLHWHKRNDYKRAAQCYEDILADYPDWEGIGGIYPLLATCYDRAGNAEYAKWTYQRMMEYYPEDSQEYLFAQRELGL